MRWLWNGLQRGSRRRCMSLKFRVWGGKHVWLWEGRSAERDATSRNLRPLLAVSEHAGGLHTPGGSDGHGGIGLGGLGGDWRALLGGCGGHGGCSTLVADHLHYSALRLLVLCWL